MYEKLWSTYKTNQIPKFIISSSCTLTLQLILIIILITTPQLTHATGTSSRHSMHVLSKSSTSPSSPHCTITLYPAACQAALAASSSSADPFSASLDFAIARAQSTRTFASNLSLVSAKNSLNVAPTALDDCVELLDATLEHLNDVGRSRSSHDVETWLSAALTYQFTCEESLNMGNVGADKGAELDSQVLSLSELISNSLALYKGWRKGGKGRKLTAGGDRFPAWVSEGDRRLLEMSAGEIRADAVVAKDGSGTHRTIGEAVRYVSLLSSLSSSEEGGGGGRSVIYVKAGTYKENVNIPTKQKKVMLMGDGKGVSVIVGSRSVGGGSTTYNSATVAAMGSGFIAKDLTIINDAGPSKHQAVALRVGSDQSVVYQCSLEGYQDTLYTLSNRQFYSQTDISGTVDFIFGDSAVVLQNCFIQPIRPMSNQRNSVTAQGRTDPNQNTGISIHKSKIQCSSDVGDIPTYLGRPWQKYSRVVVMATYLDSCVSSEGWESWEGNFALSTLYYGEYANTGPGAETSGRVKWGGVETAMSETKAGEFTVENFIYGDYWLPGTGVTYTPGL